MYPFNVYISAAVQVLLAVAVVVVVFMAAVYTRYLVASTCSDTNDNIPVSSSFTPTNSDMKQIKAEAPHIPNPPILHTDPAAGLCGP